MPIGSSDSSLVYGGTVWWEWKGGIGDGECGNWMWVMGTAGEVEVVVVRTTEAVGGAGGRVPNPGMP